MEPSAIASIHYRGVPYLVVSPGIKQFHPCHHCLRKENPRRVAGVTTSVIPWPGSGPLHKHWYHRRYHRLRRIDPPSPYQYVSSITGDRGRVQCFHQDMIKWIDGVNPPD